MDASSSFYDAVLAPLGASRQMDFGVAIGYGTPRHPGFWIGAFDSGEGFRESHLAFVRDPDGNNVEAVCHNPRA